LGELTAGRTADGSLVFCAPLDYLVWTESIGRFITAANKVIDEIEIVGSIVQQFNGSMKDRPRQRVLIDETFS
jgi:hypothetical protein